MAVLSNAERLAVRDEFMRWWSNDVSPAVIDKGELIAAINAADDWVDANASSFNSALPQPARGALNARQKARLLMFVTARRFGVI